MPPFEKNLITTKVAGKLSGYHSDYLARLARSGKIAGKKIGHSWFIDRESLSHFLSQQGDRKIDYARALARAREDEYHHGVNNTNYAAFSSAAQEMQAQDELLGPIGWNVDNARSFAEFMDKLQNVTYPYAGDPHYR